MLFAKFAWNWPSGSVEEEFKFSLVNNYLLEKCVALHWINLYTLHPRMLVLSLVEIAPLVLEKTILKFRQCILIISILSPHRKGQGSSFEQTWFPLIQRWFVQILVEIGPVVLEKFLKFVNVFLPIHNYLPLEKVGALHLNKLESPSPKDDLCQV